MDGPGRDRLQRRAAQESHLDVFREAVEGQEPALALDAVEGRVPPDGPADAGHGACDERVQAAPDVTLPARHVRDVRLHGGVAVALRDLGVAAREELRLLLRRGLLRRSAGHLGPRALALRHRVRGVVGHRFAQQRLHRALVHLVSLANVDGPPLVPGQARVEELPGVAEPGSVEERDLHLVLVGVGEDVHPLVRPDGGPHPLPVLDHLGVDLVDEPAELGQPLAPPVVQDRDLLFDPLGCARLAGHSSTPRGVARCATWRHTAARTDTGR